MKCLRISSFVLSAAICAAAAPAPVFRDGARVACFGGSITARPGAWHGFAADFCLTRHPDRDIRFTNCGRNGDGASPGFLRIGEDVAPRRPTVVAAMFGMNDVGRPAYADDPTEKQLATQAGCLAGYRRNLARVCDELRERCGPVAICLLTPTPFDENRRAYQKPPMTNLPGCNAGLGQCAAVVREVAEEKGATVVDVHSAVNEFMREGRRGDTTFQIANDRVHPYPRVNLVAAAAFLRAMGAERVVSDVALQGTNVLKAVRAEVTDVWALPDGGVAFTVLEKALPWTFPGDCEEVAAASPEIDSLNQEILSFLGLADGDWTLRIDGAEVATHTAWEWENGVNLAFNAKTPQFAQSKAALRARMEASDEAYRVESEYVRIRRRVIAELEKRGLSPDDPAARAAYIDEMLPKVSYWHWNKRCWEGVREDWDRIDGLVDACDAVWPALRALAKPVPHRYELRPAAR